MIIEVAAERTYPVIIDSSWKVELSKLLEGRSKAAIIVSEKMQHSIKDLIATDAEVLILPIADGEPSKSSTTLNQVWIGLEQQDPRAVI